MAYTANVKRPQYSANSGKGTEQKAIDRLVKVLGYKTDEKILYCEDVENGRKFEVHIEKESYLSNEKSISEKKLDVAKINWMGHDINKNMEKSNPVGSKIILKSTKVLKKDNGEGYSIMEARRVKGVPNNEPDKTFTGFFTVTSARDENGHERISRVQHWNERGIDINDAEALGKLKDEIDESASKYGTKMGDSNVTLPTIGVQFRALMKTDKKNEDGKEIYEAVDSSLPFDWIQPEGAEDKSANHPLTGDEMLSFAEGYVEYISNNEAFKDHIDDMRVELVVYRSYPASKNDQFRLTFGDPKKDANADKNPLFQLSHRQSFVDAEQTEKIMGKNYAVKGIIQISANKVDKIDGKLVEIPSYWANDLHANHPVKGHIFAIVRTSDGCKVEVHENLKLIYENRNKAENSQEGGTPAPQQRADTPSTPTPAAPKAPVDDLGDDDFNPFGEEPQAQQQSKPQEPVKTLKFGSRKV